jgi:hypothetical protein
LVKNIDVNSGFSSEDADQAVTNAESLPGFVSVTKTWDRKSQSWVVTTVTETH